MHLKLNSLQKLLDRTLDEERHGQELKAEIGRVLGPVVVTEGRLHEVVAAANDRLDVLTRTGRIDALEWESRLTPKWLDHRDPEIRKFAARIVPERFLSRAANDRSPEVRAAAAGRLSLNAIREMIKRFPKDDGLRAIFRQKKLHEAGIKKPAQQPIGHDPTKDKERLGDTVRTGQGPELTEAWYQAQAQNLMYEYGKNIEHSWEEIAVHRYCVSLRETSGVEVDEMKLLKNVQRLIKEKEDMALKRDALNETLTWLKGQAEHELIEEGMMPEFKEQVDEVWTLVESQLTRDQYLERAARVFQIKESIMPLGIRKYRLGEGNAKQTLVPCVGWLPHHGSFRPVDERALDVFCENWNRRQAQAGEPMRLEWTVHPSDQGKVGFTCILK